MNKTTVSTPADIRELEKSLAATMRTLAGTGATLNMSLQGMNEPDPLHDQSYWYIPLSEDSAHLRGVTDRIGFTKRLHKVSVHQRYAPRDPTSRAIFDVLEQTRIEWQGAAHMRGAWHNMQTQWRPQTESLSEEAALPYAVRALVVQHLTDDITFIKTGDAVERLREKLAPHITREVEGLISQFSNQQAFARASLRLIESLSKMGYGEAFTPAEDMADRDAKAEEEPSASTVEEGNPTPAIPFSEEDTLWTAEADTATASLETTVCMSMEDMKGEVAEGNLDQLDALEVSPVSKPPALEALKYSIFSTVQDEIIAAEKLVSPEELTRLRSELDEKLVTVQGSFARLSGQLQRLLLAKRQHQWSYEEEEGMLDAGRLARLVSQPAMRSIFKQKQETALHHTVVTLLLDNSGSMRGRPITIAALSSDILARVLERAGVKVEILGFTTREWKGGSHAKAWTAVGKPANPGRLNELRHIIYKAADTPFIRAKRNLGLMLKDGILKENIDGEALQWAYSRLLSRSESRKILMVISDGAPVDDATLSANHPGYLDRHLRQIIAQMEADPRLELTAIGIGHDVTRYYQRSICLKDVTKLGETMTSEMVRLFSGSAESGISK